MSTTTSRRAFLGGALAFSTGCSRPEAIGGPPASISASRVSAATPTAFTSVTAAPAQPFSIRDLEFPATALGVERAAVLVPRAATPTDRFPVLVALHGRGESTRGVEVGAYGWLRDYELGRAYARLREPPLTRSDFRGFVEEARLAAINASLALRPFRGLVVACPWVPDVLDAARRADLDASLPFGRFVVDVLLPRVVAETPARGEPAATGIDGVSLGGRVALVVGLAHSSRFGAVASLQAALQVSEARELAARARAARARNESFKLRLLTSDRDYFREAILALSTALGASKLEHDRLVVPGPHDYPFNRGPGALEMLLFHDRVLRGEAPL